MPRDDDTGGGDRALSPETLAAQALGRVEPVTRELVPPIHVSSTYERDPDGGYSSGRGYSRPHNPTYDAPEALLARLEGGCACMLTASGMAAANAVFMALLPGDHVVAPRVMYWALRKWLTDFAMPWGLDVEFVDMADPHALAAAMRPGHTRLVWIETPANPTWDVTDIAGAAKVAHGAGARLAVDSTAATPVLTRPLALGADLVVHSATKYLNGHSDVLAGAVVTAREDAFWQRMRAWRRDAGSVPGPFEAWLLLRGMRTLYVRAARACASALAIARHFEGHPRLSQVLYPGLASHPHHALATRQMQGGFGGMLSIRHRGGEAGAMATAAAVKVFKRATSLGGVESLVEHRASIEGPSTPVPADLLRLSIGLEDPADLVADLEQALAASAGVAAGPDAAVAAGGAPRPAMAPDGAAGDGEQTADGNGPVGHGPQTAHGEGAAVESRIALVLERQVGPLVRERGGDLGLARFADGVAEVVFSGSPGASVSIEREIAAMLRHYVPEVTAVRLAAAGRGVVASAREGTDAGSDSDATLAARLERLLAEQVNPAVAAHGGAIRLARMDGATAHLMLEGGCQGCAMADVTLRQGVEILVRRHLPEIAAVVDDTDHAAGTSPYFRTKKG